MNNKATFFSPSSGLYRYWVRTQDYYTVKLQVTRKVMQAFRASRWDLEEAVDILEIGGGWYHISNRETARECLFSDNPNGASAWLREFNKAHLNSVNANPLIKVVYVKRIHHEQVPADASPLLGKYFRSKDHTKRVAPGSSFRPRN